MKEPIFYSYFKLQDRERLIELLTTNGLEATLVEPCSASSDLDEIDAFLVEDKILFERIRHG